jgi:hypothetical protein
VVAAASHFWAIQEQGTCRTGATQKDGDVRKCQQKSPNKHHVPVRSHVGSGRLAVRSRCLCTSHLGPGELDVERLKFTRLVLQPPCRCATAPLRAGRVAALTATLMQGQLRQLIAVGA